MRALIILGRIVGIISFIACVILLAGQFITTGDYPKKTAEDFGTPERIVQLTRLYERVEAAPAAGELRLVEPMYSSWLPREEIGSVRIIPVSWIPGDIGIIWRSPASDGGYGSPMAYYDANGGLLGIEFRGSRYGGFLSRSTPPFPPYFQGFSTYSTGELWIVGGYSTGNH